MVKQNFSYGKKRVKALLAKERMLTVLHNKESKPHDMTDADWKDMDVKATSIIKICLADEVMYNVMDETLAVGLWLKLGLYMMNSDKLYLKKRLYSLRMKEGAFILEHMNIFYKIVSDLLYLEV